LGGGGKGNKHKAGMDLLIISAVLISVSL